MNYRSKDPIKHLDTGFRALKYSNGRNSGVTTTSLITDASSAVKINSPVLCMEGTGGTYFIKNTKSTVAVFKPKDEDPLSINNPKKQIITGFSGFKSGDGVLREVFAYELEPSLVPETRIAQLKHSSFETPKVGSLQKYVSNAESSEEYGSNLFSLSDIQEIALLDIRIVNCDRNGENLLVTRDTSTKQFKLHPIDHAFSLPSYTSFDNLRHFEWMNYRQSKLPISQDLKDKIQNINIEDDVALAKSIGIQSEAITSLRIAHLILTIGASKNKSFYDIGRFMTSKALHNLCKDTSLSVDSLLNQVSELASNTFNN